MEAETDSDDIVEYISRDSKFYASSFVQEILDAGYSLRAFPYRGRVVPELNNNKIRELLIKEYRLIYEVQEKEVFVIAIVHGRRDLNSLVN